MPTEAVLGVASKLGFAPTNTASPPTDPTWMLEFLREDLKLTVNRKNFSGIRGTRSVPGYRESVVNRSCGGSVSCQPTPTELYNLLPYILGGTPTGGTITAGTTTFPLGEALPAQDVFKVVGPVGAANSYRFQYRNCTVGKATFSGQQSGALSLAVALVGTDRDDPPTTPATWPTGLSVDETGSPWMFYQAALSFTPPAGSATAYSFREFSLVIDNAVDPNRFLNSVTRTEHPTSNRDVSLTLTRPWGNSPALLSELRAGQLSGSLTFTNGVYVLTLTMPYLIPPALNDPAVGGRDEVQFPLQLHARSDWQSNARVDELSVTLKVS